MHIRRKRLLSILTTIHTSHTHGDSCPLTFKPMQVLTVTRNLGNDTIFQACSKSFGPSIALTMRYEALDRVTTAVRVDTIGRFERDGRWRVSEKKSRTHKTGHRDKPDGSREVDKFLMSRLWKEGLK